MTIISKYDLLGRYFWCGTTTVGGTEPTNEPGVYVGDVDLFKQYHDSVTDKPVSMGDKPSEYSTFNYATKQWEDQRSLQDLKSLKNLYISSCRLKANQSSFIFEGKQIAVDQLSRSDIDAVHGIVVLNNGMPDKWVGGWKALDNTLISIPDVATWVLFYKAMVGQGSINFAHAQDLKVQLAAATTKEEVDAIVW